MNAPLPDIEPLGDRALLVRVAGSISEAGNAAVHALARRLRAGAPPAVVDVVPCYASLAVVFEPQSGADPAQARAATRSWIVAALHTTTEPASAEGPRLVTLPVHYGGEDGPDLAALAQHAGLSEDEVVHRHSAAHYTVAMLGFAPGFPYLLGMDAALAMPRLDTPRPAVPAGSVGIAAAQTGIYPQASPGGWRLIGRTDAVLFDPLQAPPTLLRPGDRVRLRPT